MLRSVGVKFRNSGTAEDGVRWGREAQFSANKGAGRQDPDSSDWQSVSQIQRSVTCDRAIAEEADPDKVPCRQ